MRADLSALSDDDLTALSNRGVARRARTEIDEGTFTVELTESGDGSVTARWSDGPTCSLPAGVSLARATCTCPAPPPCRHLVRTVMAYRARGSTGPEPAAAGAMTSASRAVPAALRERARQRFDEGQLFELVRSEKPIARCHSLGVVTRFFVPGDPNHTVCDCGDPAPCEHAVMAVWAFERLAPGVTSGLVDTRAGRYPVPSAALDEVEGVLREWAAVGVADVPTALTDRLRRTEDTCRRAGLVWVAEAIDELATLKVAYDTRDARFDAAVLAGTFGELVCRVDAIRGDRGEVPPLFVRGAASDRPVEIASAKLVGIGVGVRVRRTSLEVTAFCQDETSGHAVVVVREVQNGAETRDRAFSELARSRVAKGITLAAVASGRSLVKGATRTAGGVLKLGRAPAASHAQTFQWESLRSPMLAEGFDEVATHLAALPPRPLRPRRVAEDVHVVPVTAVARHGFDSASQAVLAVLLDPMGGQARLVHPFHAQGASGCAALLRALAEDTPVFVSGRFRRTAAGVVVEPLGLVVTRGGARRLVQPWVDGGEPGAPDAGLVGGAGEPLHDPARFVAEEVAGALGDLFVVGSEGATSLGHRAWRDLAARSEALGFGALPPRLEALVDNPEPRRMLELAAFVALASSV